MRITVLSGGVGGARFIRGLLDTAGPDDEVTVIANTADDITLFGLRVCPDLDTLMYTLGGGIDEVRGWGRRDETWHAKDELAAYGVEETWFGLGDRDLATHLVRTMRLRDGHTLTDVTTELCQRWNPGVCLLPMSNEQVETHVTLDGGRSVHFQEFWIRLRAEPPVDGVEFRGVDTALAAPGVIDAIEQADLVVLPPSNPVVSIGPIVAIDEIRSALQRTSAPVVGVSPIITGGHVHGMADQLLHGLGVEVSAAGVAERLGARAHDGILDGWLVDGADSTLVDRIEAAGISCRAVPLYMTDPGTTQQLARDTAALGLHLRRERRDP